MSCHFADIVVVREIYLCRLLFLELFFFFFFFFRSGDRLWEGDLKQDNTSVWALACILPRTLSVYLSQVNWQKGAQQYISLQSRLIFFGGGGATDLFLFLFRSDFLFFFFPLGRGERSSSKEGLQAETEQRGHFCIQTANGIGKVKSQLEEFTFLQCKIQLWNPVTWTFGLLCWGFTSPEWPVFISLASSLIKQCT